MSKQENAYIIISTISNVPKNKEAFMFRMNNKTRKIVSRILIIILILAMIVPTILTFLAV